MQWRTTLTRLAAPLALAGCLALAPAKADAAWATAFGDDGRPAWQQLFKFVGAPCNLITRAAASLRVRSCPLSAAGNKTAMIWPRKSLAGGVKIEFDFTQTSAVPVTAGTMTGVMVLASGDGTKGFPVDVTTWGAQCCGTPLTAVGYAPHTNGVQINLAYRNDPRGNDSIRVRGLKGSEGSYELLGESPPDFPFTEGRRYHVTVVRAGAKLTISAKDVATAATKTFSVSNPYIAGLKTGWVGLRQMQGRDSTFASVKVSVLK